MDQKETLRLKYANKVFNSQHDELPQIFKEGLFSLWIKGCMQLKFQDKK